MPRSRLGSFVLIVDDNIEFRDNMVEILEREGYRTAGVGDGEGALERLRSEGQPCLMLLDLNMPGMNGFEVLEALQKDLTLPETNVVVLTGLLAEADEIGNLPLLRKPCSLGTLLEIVARNSLPAIR